MEMPKPTKEHRRLAELAGRFTGRETMHPSPWDPAGGPATATVDARVALDGFALISDYAQSRNGKVTFTGHGIITWDAVQKTYLMYFFDCMGFPPRAPARGQWEGDTLTFLEENAMGNSRHRYHVTGDGKYDYTLEMSLDGTNWRTFLEGSYGRD